MRALLSGAAVRWIRGRGLHLRPPVGMVRFGTFKRLEPVSRSFGFERGTPIDRFYIEQFLHRSGERDDIWGRVLEVGDDVYARRFGVLGTRGVSRIDILDIDASNPRATMVADLASASHVESDAFDCIICTQVLLLLYDTHAAVRTLHRLLAPGGVLLVTVPGISQICREEMERVGDYWRFTSRSLRRLLEEVFPPEEVQVEAHGNVLASVSFLHGLAARELTSSQLLHQDDDFQLVVAGRARKAMSSGSATAAPAFGE